MMNKFIKNLFFLCCTMVLSAGFVACSDDEDTNNEQNVTNMKWLTDGTWVCTTDGGAEVGNIWKFTEKGQFYHFACTTTGVTQIDGTFTVDGSNLILTNKETSQTLTFVRKSDTELVVTYEGKTLTYNHCDGLTNKPELNGTTYNYHNFYTKLRYKDGKTSIIIPEHLQYGGNKELNLVKLSSQIERALQLIFKKTTFSDTKMFVEQQDDMGNVYNREFPYTITSHPFYENYQVHTLSYTAGTESHPYQVNFYISQLGDRLALLLDTEGCIENFAHFYCIAYESVTGQKTTAEDVEELKKRIADCYDECYSLIIMKK